MRVARAFAKAPGGWFGIAAIAVLIVLALVAPPLFGQRAVVVDVVHGYQNPTAQHILGTDRLGRDNFLRLLVATRLSIGLGLLAVALSMLIGIPLGTFVALLPTRLRSVGLRTIDTLIAFPALIVAIYIGTIIGPGIAGAVLGVGIANSFGLARVVSTLTMSVGGRDYIQAARVIGVGRGRLIARHVMPNIAEVLVVSVSTSIAYAVVTIAGLSFLGLGVPFPDFDWGNMLTDGVQAFYLTPAAALGPAVAIAATALTFGFAGEALARALNPILWVGSGRGRRSRGARPEAAAPQTASPPSRAPDRPAVVAAQNGRPRPTLLEVRDLRVSFPSTGGAIEVVAGVSFEVAEGEVVGIVGESGSGKTMTSLAIAQLVPYPGEVTGQIRYCGQDLLELDKRELDSLLGRDIGVVFQDPMSSLNPALTIGTQLTEAVQRHRGLGHRAATKLAITTLKEVSIPTPDTQIRRHPHELSGGMRQRVMIGMGVMRNVKVLIADEPTTALDVTIQAQIMDILAKVNHDYQMGILLISHNLGLVRQNCDRVIVMYCGRIVEELPVDRLAIDPLHPYTAALLAAVPDMTRPRDSALEFIAGEAPDLAAPPAGCPFHPRCPLALEKCTRETPPLVGRSNGRRVACWVANKDLH